MEKVKDADILVIQSNKKYTFPVTQHNYGFTTEIYFNVIQYCVFIKQGRIVL